MNKLIAALSVAGLAASGLALTPTAVAAPTPATQDIKWEKCTEEPLKGLGADCGFVEAPLDYDKPDGEKIQIAVSRIAHKSTEQDYLGPILVNPGGPGGSGLAMSSIGARVPHKAGERFDWIGFDPRGVGASKPALTCDKNVFAPVRPGYLPTDPIIEQTNLDRAKSYADKCAQSGGALLEHIKTTDTVRDMDTIRRALGVEKINYYGFSYGTYLGQVYATMFAEHLGRVVFDGVVDHRNVWYKANLNQDVAFEKGIRIFFDWVAQYDSTFKLGKTGLEVMARYYADQRALAHSPAGGVVGGSEFADLFLPAGYSQRRWDGIARAWSNWAVKGDVEGLKAKYNEANGPGDDNGYAMYLGTQCSDVQWPRKWSTWERDNWRTFIDAPFYTWANAWYNASCLYWGAKPGTPVEINAENAPPVLLINEVLDGATPFSGALEARRILPGSSLISVPEGTTHSNSLRGNSCVDDRIAEYLTTGRLPQRLPGENRADLECKALPKPVPSAADARISVPTDPTEIMPRR